MKYVFLTALMFLSCFAFANKIDSLKTDQDIEVFISKQYSITYQGRYNYYNFTIARPDSVFDNYSCDSILPGREFKHWEKTDFNKDGNTDLFAAFYIKNIYGGWARFITCAIIDEGNHKFLVRQIPGNSNFYCYAVMPAIIGGDAFLLYRHHVIKWIEKPYQPESSIDDTSADVSDIVKTDTLLYKFGGFVEMSRPSQKVISAVFFSTSFCFGSCPSFDLEINNDGIAGYFLREGMEDKESNSTGIIRKEDLNQLKSLITYINVDILDSSYAVLATDHQSSILTVKFTDGSKKIIKDYGLQGTLGLERVYEILDGFRKNQQWKPTKFNKTKARKAYLGNLLHRN